MEQDVERGTEEVPQSGYPALGNWIAEDPDSETFIFRKFSRLSARNLLFLQSKVFALESELDRLDKELCNADEDLRHSMRRWETFVERAEDINSPEAKRLSLMNNITMRLGQYREYPWFAGGYPD